MKDKHKHISYPGCFAKPSIRICLDNDWIRSRTIIIRNEVVNFHNITRIKCISTHHNDNSLPWPQIILKTHRLLRPIFCNKILKHLKKSK